ncbi:hypothetical protein D7X33_34315 [Butyricicoccus sp. 1XD8-22]|nr:hypothetical protein D7X33_34315 [Butyricicoccus sp. 1XD8-22]
MLPIVVVCISLLLNIILFFLMYKGVYIPGGKTPFFIALTTATIYLLVGRIFGENKSRRLTRWFVFSISLYLAFSLSGLVYHNWKMESLLSSFSMMKISLFVLVAIIVYLNVVYIRAEISYKRKRGNQRIQKEPKKSQIDVWREKKKKQEENVISIQLGQSTESEEKAPPI